jgi:hypothetical protein
MRAKHRVSDRAHRPEKEISDTHQDGFQAQGSRGDEFIRTLVPSGNLTCQALATLAKIFSAISGIPFHRDFTRRRALVVKWFNDNLDTLEPIQSIVTLFTEAATDKDDHKE